MRAMEPRTLTARCILVSREPRRGRSLNRERQGDGALLLMTNAARCRLESKREAQTAFRQGLQMAHGSGTRVKDEKLISLLKSGM